MTGLTPECKPITCGRPPEAPNAVAHLANGSTLWRSLARYECKPGFRSTAARNSNGHLQSWCSESGLWEPPPRDEELRCRFDPDAAEGQIEGEGQVVQKHRV